MFRLTTRRIAGLIAIILIVLAAGLYSARELVVARVIGQAIGGTANISVISSMNLSGIQAKGIQLSNPDFRFRAGELILSIDIVEFLFNGNIFIRQASLHDAEAVITPEPRQRTEGGDDKPVHVPLITLESFSVRDTRISYRDADQNFVVLLKQCDGSVAQQIVNWQCTGEVQDESVELRGKYGLPDEKGNAEPFSLAFNWQDIDMHVDGRMDHPLSLTGARLQLGLTAVRSMPLLELLGIREVRDSSIDLTASFQNSDSGVDLSMQGLAGGMEMKLSGKAASLETLAETEFNFDISGPSLYEAGAMLDYFRFEDEPFAMQGSISRTQAAGLVARDVRIVLKDGDLRAQLAMPRFPATDSMTLDLKGEQMSPSVLQPFAGTCGLPHEALDWQGNIRVDASGIERVDFDIQGPAHSLQVSGTLNTNNVPGAIDLHVTSGGFTFLELGQCFNLQLPEVSTRIETDFTWQSGLLTFRRIDLESGILNASGRLTVEPAKLVPFDMSLALSTRDARTLAAALVEDTGPLNSFALNGQLSIAGDRTSIPDFGFTFQAAGHDGSITGALGEPASLKNLDLQVNLAGSNLRSILIDPEQRSDAAQPFSISTNLRRTDDSWLLSDIQLAIVNTEIMGSARITDEPRLHGSSVQLSGKGGNFENLLGPWLDTPIPNEPFELDIVAQHNTGGLDIGNLDLRIGGHHLKAALLIASLPDLSRSRGSVELSGPSTVALMRLLNQSLPVLDRPYELSLEIEGDPESITANNIKAAAGESDLMGWLKYTATSPPAISVDLQSNNLYLPLLNPSLLEGKQTDGPKRRFVFPDDPLPLELLERFNGNLKYSAARVWVDPAYGTSVNADLVIADGGISTRQFSWEGVHAKGSLSASLKPDADSHVLQLSAESDRLPIIWLLAGDSEPSTGTSFHLDVTSRGGSIRRLMSALNGTMLFKGGGGRIKGRKLNLFFGDFLQTVASNITENKEPNTLITCTAGAVSFKNGMARVNPGFVARTDKVDVFATGEVNLTSEATDLTILTKSRTGIGLSAAKVVAPRLKVKGTLAEPKFQVDTTGTAINTWLALYSGGMSLVASGLWDRITSAGDSCNSLYTEAKTQAAYRHYNVTGQ